MKTKLFFILVFSLISRISYSQGFSIEHFDEYENWRFVKEDADGRIITAGFYKPTPSSNVNDLEVRIYSAQGQLLNKRNITNPKINTICDLVVTDTSYVVFYTESRPYTSKWFAYSAHFSRNLQTLAVRSWGDTNATVVPVKVLPVKNSKDWIMVLHSFSPTVSFFSMNQLSNDFSTVKKEKQIRIDYDSTVSPQVRDLVELPNKKGYAVLLNGEFVSDSLYSTNLYAIALLDTGFNVIAKRLVDVFENQTSADRMGVLDYGGRGGIALESDTSLAIYGCVFYYKLSPFMTNLCLSDTCVRQIRTTWRISDLTNLSYSISNWTGKPAYYEKTLPINEKWHLVMGSLERDDRRMTSNTDYPTTISIEEYHGGQRLIRRLLQQSGYWLKPIDVAKAKNGDYIILARYNDFLISGNALSKPMLTRVDSAGQFLVFSENLMEVPVKVWPNPVNGRVLKLDLAEEGESRVTLLDLQGRMLEQQPFSEKNPQLDLSAYPAGMYLLRIQQTGKAPKTVKLVLP